MFFSKFPKKLYNFNFVANSTVAVTNILSRVRFNSKILNSVSAYTKYQLQDGDTPEIVSYKAYGDPEYHWAIILVNNLKDPYFDVPLPINALESTILKKYGYTSIEQAQDNVHHYILETTSTLNEGGITTTNVKNTIITLQQYSYQSNALITLANTPATAYVYPHNSSNTIYFKANNSGQNTANSTNATASLQIVDRVKPISIYDYEIELNEGKREIKLLKQEYLEPLSAELNRMLGNQS